MTEITTEEVCAYREIYYEHVKPALIKGSSQKDIEKVVEYFSPDYNLTVARFDLLHTIDLFQRLAELKRENPNANICVKVKSHKLTDLSVFLKMPTLRCPKRSEQPYPI